MKFPSQLFEAPGTDLIFKDFLQARRKLIFIYLAIIAVVIILFSYLVVLVVNQHELANRLPSESEILLNTNEARIMAEHQKPNSNIRTAEYQLKDGILLYKIHFEDDKVIYVDVISGRVFSDKELRGSPSLYKLLTDETNELVGWLALLVFLLASLGSIAVANASLRPIAINVRKQKRFVSDAAHELRNPLASLQTTLESYLRSKDRTQQFGESVAEDLLLEVKRLIAVSEELLAFEKHEKTANIIACSMQKVLDVVLARLESLRAEKNISIVQNLSEEVIFIDPQDLDSVLYNLLHNAIKFSDKDAKIEVTWKGKELKLVDTGIGIAPEQLPHIFERFYKADTARSFSVYSSGLGLALVHEIIDSYGGEIAVVSEPGKGTAFTINFK